MNRAELRRTLRELPEGDPWRAREVLEAHIRRRAMAELRQAHRRRVRVKGRGTTAGVRLAVARFRRWQLGAPMFERREARA